MFGLFGDKKPQPQPWDVGAVEKDGKWYPQVYVPSTNPDYESECTWTGLRIMTYRLRSFVLLNWGNGDPGEDCVVVCADTAADAERFAIKSLDTLKEGWKECYELWTKGRQRPDNPAEFNISKLN